MRKVCHALTLLLFLVGSKCAFAVKSLKLDIGKDPPIVVEVPPDLWESKEISFSSSVPISSLRVDNAFLASKSWEDGKLPLLVEFHIEKAQDCGSGVMSGRIVGCPANWKQLELRSTKAWLKLQFSPDVLSIEDALRQIVFVGSVAQFESTPYLHDKVFNPNQARLFASLPELPQEQRYSLFKFGVDSGLDISSVKFKGLDYVQVGIPNVGAYNTIRVSQDQRVSEVVKDTILPEAKLLLPLIAGKPVGGLAFHLSIPAYNFVTGGEAKYDDLMVYLSVDQLEYFESSDITSQKLLDNSFVLLNGDRIEAKL